jgi:hypothetical protein
VRVCVELLVALYFFLITLVLSMNIRWIIRAFDTRYLLSGRSYVVWRACEG